MKKPFFAMLACMALFAVSAQAQEMNRPGPHSDDKVMFDISAEDWVTTKTAHVAVSVEAAVNASTAGTMRGEMMKSVGALAKADWRLTSFDRSQDQTGLERWSAVFEARLPETDLGNLGDMVKKQSKAGMQLSVVTVDFTPTLEEMEAARGNVRAQIYKIANEQLAALNAAMPGRTYRIALIDFTGEDSGVSVMPRVVKGRVGMAMMANAMQAPESAAATSAPVERAEKITLTARVGYAAMPENKTAPVMPAPAAPKQ